MSKDLNDLKKIAKTLSSGQLQHLNEKDLSFDFSELFEIPEKRGSHFFLDYYSPEGIKFALEKYGIFEVLKQKGLDNILLSIESHDIYRQKLAIYFEHMDEDHLLCEIILRRKFLNLNNIIPKEIMVDLPQEGEFDLLVVEWLYSQNPKEKFSPERPRLPGQKHPGLKTGKIILKLLLLTCERLKLNGLVNLPAHFHNAQIYSTGFSFISPEFEGKRLAIARDLLGKYNLATISWAVEEGCIRENGLPFKWFISEQVDPLDKNLQNYFAGKKYRQLMESALKNNIYTLDEECWKEKKPMIGI